MQRPLDAGVEGVNAAPVMGVPLAGQSVVPIHAEILVTFVLSALHVCGGDNGGPPGAWGILGTHGTHAAPRTTIPEPDWPWL